MEAIEDVHTRHRVVTDFITVEGYSQKEIYRHVRSMCGEKAKDISSVTCWVHHFNSGGKNNSNRPRSDPSAVEVIRETKDRVDAMILNNRCITTCEMWAAIGIGKPAVVAIIREVGNNKICAKLVLKMVTIEHKPP